MGDTSGDIANLVRQIAVHSQRVRDLYEIEKLLVGFLGSFRLFRRELKKISENGPTVEQAEELSDSWDQLYNLVVRLKQILASDREPVASIEQLEKCLADSEYEELYGLAHRIDVEVKREGAGVGIELHQTLNDLIAEARLCQMQGTS